MSDSSVGDEQLAAAVGLGDASAAREIYSRHASTLFRFARAMTGARAHAEDVVHDTIVQFLENPDGYEGTRGPLIAYLLGIARRRVRRGARRAAGSADAEPALEPPLEDEASRRELVERVRNAVLALPLAQREVVTLCDLQELPYSVVAQVLDCPVGTIRSRLHRARALLAIRLAEEGLAPAEGEFRTVIGMGQQT